MAAEEWMELTHEPDRDHQLERKDPEELDAVTIRFAGDSGDGIQLTGMQFTTSTAIAGNDLSTLPDYPPAPPDPCPASAAIRSISARARS